MDIKSVIKSKGFTINSVADAMGVNRISFSQTISNNPTIKTLRRIAEIIGCNVSDFFADENATKDIIVIYGDKLFKASSIEELEAYVNEWKTNNN